MRPILPKRQLNLAIASYFLPASNQRVGGVDRVVHDLAQGLAGRGHKVTVWSFDPAPPGALYGAAMLPGRRWARNWLGKRLIMGYLGNFLLLFPRYGKIDVLIAVGDSLLAPLRTRPTLRIMHGSALSEALSASSPWRFVSQFLIYVQELLTAMTQPTVGVSANTAKYNPFVRQFIPNGVDRTIFHPGAGMKTPEPSLMFVGTLGGRKRGALLIKWFIENIQPRFPNASLHMVSRPGQAETGVTYHTDISGQQLADLYRQCWIYASPSVYEGFGLPYVEAMASATPVVATPNPGSREVLADGKWGVLADDASFPEAVVTLLGDASKREAFAAAGLERARQYDVQTMIDAYEAYLYRAARHGRHE